MFLPFHLLKLKSGIQRKNKIIFIPSTSSNPQGCTEDRCAHIYASGVSFSQLEINGNLRVTPAILHPMLPLLPFLAKTEKSSPTVPHLRLPFIPSLENRLCACKYARSDPCRILPD
jgi:hypothetical protein